MRSIRLATPLAFLVAIAFATPNALAAVTEAETAEIDRQVVDRLAANGVPGASVAIVDGDRTVHVRAFGTTGRFGQDVSVDHPSS